MSSLDGRPSAETTGPRRSHFASDLTASIRRRALHLNG